MKAANTHIASAISKVRAVILLGTLAAVVTTVACSSNSRPAVNSTSTSTSSLPASAGVRPAVVESGVPAVAQTVPVAKKTSSAMKPSASKLIVYKSRDYGVSFLYPWQYAFLSARAVANGDASLRPISDGHEGQFTLARIEVPKGFYSDTNYEHGYFILSLNPSLNQQECESALSAGTAGKVESDTINGVEFRWRETDSGGHGQAAKLRQYVAFTNGTCYELELGVKTRNEDGLAREVDPDQVLRRLDAILRTVKIVPAMEKNAVAEVESPTVVPAPVSQD